MKINITNENGVIIKTQNKYVKEDIEVTVDSSILGSKISVDGTKLVVKNATVTNNTLILK